MYQITDGKITFAVEKYGNQYTGHTTVDSITRRLKIYPEDLVLFLEQCEKNDLIQVKLDNDNKCSVNITNSAYNKTYEIELTMSDPVRYKLSVLQQENEALKSDIGRLRYELTLRDEKDNLFRAECNLEKYSMFLCTYDEDLMNDVYTVLTYFEKYPIWKQGDMVYSMMVWFKTLFNTSSVNTYLLQMREYDTAIELPRNMKTYKFQNNKQFLLDIKNNNFPDNIKPLFKKIFLYYMKHFNNIHIKYPCLNPSHRNGSQFRCITPRLLNYVLSEQTYNPEEYPKLMYILDILEETKVRYDILMIPPSNDLLNTIGLFETAQPGTCMLLSNFVSQKNRVIANNCNVIKHV